jgi:hypothetical protein
MMETALLLETVPPVKYYLEKCLQLFNGWSI